MITRIKVSNFKSFRSLDLNLRNLNILIGANASGKSNFVQVFRFLRDLIAMGLDDAVSLQGGPDYITNARIGRSEEVSVSVCSDAPQGQPIPFYLPVINGELLIYETQYELALRFDGGGSDAAEVTSDRLFLRGRTWAEPAKAGTRQRTEAMVDTRPAVEMVIANRGGRQVVEKANIEQMALPGMPWSPVIGKNPLYPLNLDPPPGKLLMHMPVWSSVAPFSDLGSLSIFDFDPHLPKRSAPIVGKAQLEEDASNLALVLKNLIADPDKRRPFMNLLTDALPFVDALDVDQLMDKSLLLKMRETFFRDHYLPAYLISDGTMNVAALIVALYFDPSLLTIIEEPERNIHPHLISKVAAMMEEASKKKQVIVTTHNPQLVANADIESLLLVSRDQDGFSVISRPAEQEEVRTFLENEVGIDELFVSNLLGR